MKVKELIEAFENCDQEREVLICVHNNEYYSPIANIHVEVKTKTIVLFPVYP